MNDRRLADRLGRLTEQATELRARLRQTLSNDEQDDTLWMSSLDVVEELLNEMDHELAAEGTTECPQCHQLIVSSPLVEAGSIIVCPTCGLEIVLVRRA